MYQVRAADVAKGQDHLAMLEAQQLCWGMHCAALHHVWSACSLLYTMCTSAKRCTALMAGAPNQLAVVAVADRAVLAVCGAAWCARHVMQRDRLGEPASLFNTTANNVCWAHRATAHIKAVSTCDRLQKYFVVSNMASVPLPVIRKSQARQHSMAWLLLNMESVLLRVVQAPLKVHTEPRPIPRLHE